MMEGCCDFWWRRAMCRVMNDMTGTTMNIVEREMDDGRTSLVIKLLRLSRRGLSL